MGWITADAPTRPELQACNQCGLCLPVCPTFRITGRETASPRGRLLAMNAVDKNLAVVDELFDEMMSFCLQCRACEAVCPSLAPYGRAMEGTRVELAAQLPSGGRRFRRLVTGRLIASRRFMRLVTAPAAIAQRMRLGGVLPAPLRRGFSGLRPLPIPAPSTVGEVYPAVGRERGVVALLAGCVMDPWFGEVRTATIEVLRRGGYRVEIPDGQTCCGALAAHDGDAAGTRRLAKENVAAFAGADLVVTDAAGCGAHLKEYGHWVDGGSDLGARVRDVTEIVSELIADGSLPTIDPNGERVGVQDPCHLRHVQRIVEPPRTILRAAGYEPVEIDPDGLCCGAAGIYSLRYPDASSELGARKAEQVRTAGVSLVASANPGCELQVRSHLGPDHRVAHPVELYWAAIRGSGGNLDRT